MEPSPKYSLNQADIIEMMKVMAWSLGATIVTVLLSFLNNTEVPPQYAFLLPVINSLLYSVKLFLDGKVVR